MLPFLNSKAKEASVSMPPETVKRDPDVEPEYDTLESAAEDMIAAFHAKDAKALCMAFRAAFDLLESEPHEEAAQ